MKKNTNSRFRIPWLKTKTLMLMLFACLFLYWGGNAQTTITTGDATTASGGAGWMAFNFVNTNAYPVIITDVSVESNTTATNAEAYIYTSTTPVNGAPGNISSSPNWVQAVNQTVNVTSNSTNLVPVITNAAVVIPPNTTVGMAIGLFTSSGATMSRYSSASGLGTPLPVIHSGGGVDLEFSSTSAYAGGAFTAGPTFNPRGFIGSITFEPALPCSGTPTAGTATASARTCFNDDVVLSLTGSTLAAGLTYQWESSPAGAGTFSSISGATSLSHTISNPAVSTDYRCVVSCGTNSTTSTIVSVASMSPPTTFYESFDTTSTGTSSNPSIPDCWSYIDDVVSTGYGYTIASDPLSGSNSFRLYRTNSSGNSSQELVLISPKTTDLGNGTKQVRFYARSYSTTNYDNKLEILSMPSDTTTVGATVLATFTPNQKTYEEYVVALPATTDDFFGFRLAYTGASTNSSIIIDDVFYEDLDACAPPTDITISNIGQTTADISWTASSATGVTQYEYEVRSTGAPGSGSAGLGASGTVSGTTVNITGLSASIGYSVYVRSLCGTTPGRWTYIPGQFNTLCGVVTGTFYESFDNVDTGGSTNPTVPYCWTYIRNSTVTSLYGYTTTSAGQTGKGFYTYRSSAGDGDLFLISPETNNLGAGTRQIRFSARVSSTTYIPRQKLEVYTMSDTTATANKTLIQGNIPLTEAWQEFIVPIPNTTDDYFMFSFERDGGLTYTYIDDIYYEDLSPCIFPTNLQINNITESTATISWTASLVSGVTAYEYEVRSSGEPGSGATGLAASGSVSAPATTANITGLTGATDYVVYVRSVCSGTSGAWTTYPLAFQSACPIFNDFFEGFETTQTGSTTNNTVPLCWSYIGATSGYYGYTSTDSSRTGSNGFRYYKTTAYASDDLLLVSPETNNLGNGAKQVRFWVKVNSGTANVPVYTLDNNTSTATKTQIALIPVNTTWTEYTVSFPITTDDYFAIGFLDNSSSTQLLLDDIYYEDVEPPTIVSFTKSDVLCYDANTGDISIEVEGGALPLTYTWSPAVSTTDTATGLAGGTYTVTVTDGLNRTASETITIDEPDEILSNAIVTGISCNGADDASITIAPSGGIGPYTILWSTNDTGDTVSNLVPGTYSVTITDANFCVLTEDFTIIEPGVLTATGTQTDVSTYLGSDGEAVVSLTGGTAPFTYTWTPAVSTTDTASNLTAGTYTVDITDANGCTTTHAFIITEPLPLMIESHSHTHVSCNGAADGTATVNVIGGNAPYTYEWSPSGGSASSATGLAAGTYTLEIKDSTNNILNHTVVITEPGIIVPTLSHKTDVVCSSTATGSATITVSGGVAPFTYTWSHGPTTQNATLSNLSAGTYLVSVKDANGCTSATNVTVVIDQPTPIAITSTNTTDVSCFGMSDGSLTVAVTGGVPPYNYSWSNGQSGTSISNLTHGTYTVTVTDANNCTQSQSFSVTQPPFVNPPSASPNQGFCSGQNATLNDVIISGTNLKWYSSFSGGTVLPASTILTNGSTYYASQTVGTCESTRTAVQVTLYSSTPLVTTQLNVCGNTRIQSVDIDGYNYTQLSWYDNVASTTPLPASQLLTSKTYYVSSVTGTCESARQTVQVTVSATVPAPTAAFQTVCGGTTLADLVVTKDPSGTLNWFSSLQSMIPLAHSTLVTTGTYYVQQVIGNCESNKVAVQVQVTNVTPPIISAINTCEGLTIADYNTQNGTNYVWYIDNNSGTTPLPDTQIITSGSYYIANEVSGCLSQRRNIAVNVSPIPLKPTGQAIQTFGYAATIGDLRMNEPNVRWFATYQDAIDLINELADTTPLVNDQIYYGVLVGDNNCASEPTEVQAKVTVGLLDLDLAQLNYFPNPVDTELNINYIENITKVEVYTINGQKVFTNEYTSNEIKVDLSTLSSGTYMVRVQTDTAAQFIKIVKR